MRDANRPLRAFYNRDLADAFALIQEVPDGTGLAERGGHDRLGLLVCKRIAPLDLVNELAGGGIVVMSRNPGGTARAAEGGDYVQGNCRVLC